jgi:hypothetical protein
MPLPAAIPIQKYFDKDTVLAIEKHVERSVDSLLAEWKVLRETKITAWRRVYRGIPREKYKSFPWKGAANLVPRIVSSFTDQLTARLIMGLYGTDPLFPAGLLGTFKPDEMAEEQRSAVEQFMSAYGKSPQELNLFQAEYSWFHNANKYGFSALKHSWEHQVEQVAEAAVGGDVVFRDYVKYDGPRPLPILFEKFMCPLKISDFRQSNFMDHITTLTEAELRDRKARKLYPANKVDAILAMPTRYGPDQAQREMETDINASSPTYEKAEWDLHEGWFPFFHQGKTFHLLATWHKETKTLARCVFNFLPDNMVPFKLARLGTDGESIMSMGFCELLGVYQEEIAQIHNQRRDSGTLANTTIIRADAASQLDTNFSVYPMAVLVGNEGQFSFEQIGRASTETIKDEQMTLQLAQDAAGIGPSSSGSGAGSVNKKGSYSSMGTFATSQEGNTRANLHQTTSRFSHLTLGNDLLKLYAHLGIDKKKIAAMGEMGENLSKALENVRSGRMWIPIHAATGSINKEVEKQNKMLMLQHFRAHYQYIQQILGMSANPMVPPDTLKYALETADAANLVMTGLVRDFGYDDPSRMLPDPGVKAKIVQIDQKAQQAQQQPQQGQGVQPPVSLIPGATPQNVSGMAQ